MVQEDCSNHFLPSLGIAVVSSGFNCIPSYHSVGVRVMAVPSGKKRAGSSDLSAAL
jgi:hypothetical protein